MHLFAGLLLVLATALNLLIGGGLVMSSRAEALRVRTDAGDLSSVAGDLAPEETLQRDRQQAEQQMDLSGSRGKLVLGALVLALAGLQLVAGILAFLRRARSIVLVIIAASVLGLGVSLGLSGFSVPGGVALGALVLAFALVMRTRRASVARG